jgi:hypothetical protein
MSIFKKSKLLFDFWCLLDRILLNYNLIKIIMLKKVYSMKEVSSELSDRIEKRAKKYSEKIVRENNNISTNFKVVSYV